MAELEFFDCSTFIGQPMNAGAYEPATAASLQAEMARSGIAAALVWHLAQLELDPVQGNRMLVQDLAADSRLAPCWSILPPQTGELGELDDFFAAAASAGVKAFRAWGAPQKYLLRADVLGDVLERMIQVRMPLLLSIGRGLEWPAVYELLAELPELRVILCDIGCWGSDRYFRPLVERYPNVHVEISGYMLDGGIEAFVGDYGSRRMLFGSNFPAAYHGGMMLALAHAEIDFADKQAIAGGNLRALLGEVRL